MSHEVSRRRFGGLPGAPEEHPAATQVGPEELLREPDHHRADRNLALGNCRPGPDDFRAVERFLEEPVEHRAGRTELEGGEVGVLDLRGNFRFPENHRFEASRDSKQMGNGFRAP